MNPNEERGPAGFSGWEGAIKSKFGRSKWSSALFLLIFDRKILKLGVLWRI